ncbi:hypothetical protein D3C72_1737150 [compost metagenome]
MGIAMGVALHPASEADQRVVGRNTGQFGQAERPQVTHFEYRLRAELPGQRTRGQECVRMRAGSYYQVGATLAPCILLRMKSHLQAECRHVQQAACAVTLIGACGHEFVRNARNLASS